MPPASVGSTGNRRSGSRSRRRATGAAAAARAVRCPEWRRRTISVSPRRRAGRRRGTPVVGPGYSLSPRSSSGSEGIASRAGVVDSPSSRTVHRLPGDGARRRAPSRNVNELLSANVSLRRCAVQRCQGQPRTFAMARQAPGTLLVQGGAGDQLTVAAAAPRARRRARPPGRGPRQSAGGADYPATPAFFAASRPSTMVTETLSSRSWEMTSGGCTRSTLAKLPPTPIRTP